MIKKGRLVKLVSAPRPHKYLEGRIFIQRCDSMIVSPIDACGVDFPVMHYQDSSYKLELLDAYSDDTESTHMYVGNRVELVDNCTHITKGSRGTIREIEGMDIEFGIGCNNGSELLISVKLESDGEDDPTGGRVVIPANKLTNVKVDSGKEFLLGETLIITKAPVEHKWVDGRVFCQRVDSEFVLPANYISDNLPKIRIDDPRFRVQRETSEYLKWSCQVTHEGNVFRIGDRVESREGSSKTGTIVSIFSSLAHVDWDGEKATSTVSLSILMHIDSSSVAVVPVDDRLEKESDRIFRGGGLIDYDAELDSIISPSDNPNRDIIPPIDNSSPIVSFRIGDMVTISGETIASTKQTRQSRTGPHVSAIGDMVTIKGGEIEVDMNKGRVEWIRPGDVGVVVGVKNNKVAVSWEELTVGHTCDGLCPAGRGWYIEGEELELVDEKYRVHPTIPYMASSTKKTRQSLRHEGMYEIGDEVEYFIGASSAIGVICSNEGSANYGICLRNPSRSFSNLDGYLMGLSSEKCGVIVNNRSFILHKKRAEPWLSKGDRVITNREFRAGQFTIPEGSTGTIVGVDPNCGSRAHTWVVRWDNLVIPRWDAQGGYGEGVDASRCSWVGLDYIDKAGDSLTVELGVEMAPAGEYKAPRKRVETSWDVDDWGGAHPTLELIVKNSEVEPAEENLFAKAESPKTDLDVEIGELSRVDIFKF
jgi:hypothetical protein